MRTCALLSVTAGSYCVWVESKGSDTIFVGVLNKMATIYFLIIYSTHRVRYVAKFLNFQQNLSAFVRGWQLVTVGATWPFWIMWHQLEDDSWDVQAGVPVQSRRPLCPLPWRILMACLILLLAGLGRLHVQCNRLRLRLPLGSVIMITIMITQFSKVIEYDYDYTTKVIDYNYDYNETGLRLIMTYVKI